MSEMNEPLNERMKRNAVKCKNEQMNACMQDGRNEWNACMHACMRAWMDGCMDKLNEWMNGWMEGIDRMNE